MRLAVTILVGGAVGGLLAWTLGPLGLMLAVPVCFALGAWIGWNL